MKRKLLERTPAHIFGTLLMVLGLMMLFAAPAAAVDPVNKSWFGGVAIKGYDPVAYFTEGKPVEGREDFEYEWNGAVWRFASAENRAKFVEAPEQYAPQYGGYCAYAVSQGITADIDPQAWKVVDDKLYLNVNKSIQQKWEGNIDGYIEQADVNWPKILAEG